MLNHSQGVTVHGGSLTNVQSYTYHGPGAVLTFYTPMDSSQRQLVTKIKTLVQNNGQQASFLLAADFGHSPCGV